MVCHCILDTESLEVSLRNGGPYNQQELSLAKRTSLSYHNEPQFESQLEEVFHLMFIHVSNKITSNERYI